MPQGVMRVAMRPVLLTTDPVLLSFARAVLADSGIPDLLADQFTSAIEGSLGIFPRRLLVPVEAWHRARRALTEAGLAHELVPDTEAKTAADGLEAWHGSPLKR
jgi:Putative prokaryotic signal transducing protein